MARFAALLRKYREQTECDPPGYIEARVLARLRGGPLRGAQVYLGAPANRLAAMAAGLAIGLLTVAAPPLGANAATPVPELTVFAPDAPHLPSTWLGRIK